MVFEATLLRPHLPPAHSAWVMMSLTRINLRVSASSHLAPWTSLLSHPRYGPDPGAIILTRKIHGCISQDMLDDAAITNRPPNSEGLNSRKDSFLLICHPSGARGL